MAGWWLRGLLWLARRWRPEGGWGRWGLALLVVLWPAWAVAATGWVREGTGAWTWTAWWAFLLAWWAWGRLPKAWAWVTAVGGAYPVVLTTVARVWPAPALWARLLWEVGTWLMSRGETGRPDLAWQAWTTVFLWQWQRFHEEMITWLHALGDGRVPSGRPAFLTLMALLLYGIAWWTVWAVRRREDGLLAAVPTVAVCGWNAYLADRSLWWLVGSLGLAVALTVVVHYERLEARWRRQRVDYSEELRFDFTLVALTAAIVTVVTTPVLPLLASPQVRSGVHRLLLGPWTRVEQEAARLFPDVPRPGGRPRAAPGAQLPRAHKLGAGPDLLDREVMTVRPAEGPWSRPVYWFGRAYDVYTGQGWTVSPWQYRSLAAGEPWQPAVGTARVLRRHTVTVKTPTTVVYAAGHPVAVDRPARALVYPPADLAGLELDTAARTYTVLAAVLQVDAATLAAQPRHAYPEWTRRYLQVPETVPERVRHLARRLTQGVTSPYERARAIETFLRTFPYSLDVPVPPPDRDVVDWFLFDLRRGYCDYYASAFVVLARLSGLPARFVIGYATGRWDPQAGVYRVTEREAHSWPEVYIPGVGWVPFEPTAARAVFDWEAQPSVPTAQEAPASRLAAFQAWATRHWRREALWRGVLRVLAGVGVGLMALIVGLAFWLGRLPAPARAYAGLLVLGRALGVSWRPTRTPREYGREVLSRLARRSGRAYRWGKERLRAGVEKYNAWRYGRQG